MFDLSWSRLQDMTACSAALRGLGTGPSSIERSGGRPDQAVPRHEPHDRAGRRSGLHPRATLQNPSLPSAQLRTADPGRYTPRKQARRSRDEMPDLARHHRRGLRLERPGSFKPLSRHPAGRPRGSREAADVLAELRAISRCLGNTLPGDAELSSSELTGRMTHFRIPAHVAPSGRLNS